MTSNKFSIMKRKIISHYFILASPVSAAAYVFVLFHIHANYFSVWFGVCRIIDARLTDVTFFSCFSFYL